MSKSGFVARCAAVTVGSMLLAGVAGIAMAAEPDDAGVDVNVSIAEISEPGVLALSVADTTTTLTEEGSTATVRQFTGTLPTVTVTDTRTADEIPDDAFWSVVGSSTDFTGDAGQPTIGAGHLGWAPNLIDGGESGQVAEGGEVVTVLDDETLPGNNVGLVDQELLAMAFDSGDIAAEGQWTANASLFLRTPATVAAGDYTARLTLSLFE
ncbi:hypothetical protein [Agromyces laixinhei]|uniref:hypothetical protein n=1 Tax=Agromyces laixinhei TaxID=2585717 RepID=UPI0012EE5C10|nr:hypothetical protein [Agromyces laixinhei]